MQFDNEYEEVYTGRAIAEVPSLTLVPRGSTAMLDAIGRAVNATGARLAALPEDQRPGTVIVGIMTDGLENASREFSYRNGQGADRAAGAGLRLDLHVHGGQPGRDRGRRQSRASPATAR